MLRYPANFITTALVIGILVSLALGVYQANRQAQQIAQLYDDQSPLVFSFVSAAGTRTVVVTCERGPEMKAYGCKTEQFDQQGMLIPNTTQTPVAPESPTPTSR